MTGAAPFLSALRPPDGETAIPPFDRGWQRTNGDPPAPFLAYARSGGPEANWSEDLEALHEESSRTHFIDVWTRRAILKELLPTVSERAVIADLGCSSGYLLEDLHAAYPRAFLVGVDLVAQGLSRAHVNVPDAALILADVSRLPFGDASVDVVVSANLLEHVPDDTSALREIGRILRPGGRAAIVVPAGAGLYDYYDRFLDHVRRYKRRELASRAREAGLKVVRDVFVGSLVYPAFWLTKKHNRLRFGALSPEETRARVAQDIGRTTNSRVGYVACAFERRLIGGGLTIPFGVRSLVVAERSVKKGWQ